MHHHGAVGLLTDCAVFYSINTFDGEGIRKRSAGKTIRRGREGNIPPAAVDPEETVRGVDIFLSRG